MTDSEKIIKAIEKAKKQSEQYALDRIVVPFKEADMILAMLKEQEPRVMTLLEIEQSEKCIVWFEDDQFNENTPYNYALVDGIDQRNGWIWLSTIGNIRLQQRRDYENYGKRWRCWTKRPAEDQRKAVKWE